MEELSQAAVDLGFNDPFFDESVWYDVALKRKGQADEERRNSRRLPRGIPGVLS